MSLSRYKTASNELVQWILITSGVDHSQAVPVSEIVELGGQISIRQPPTPPPRLIHERFKSGIYLRSVTKRLKSRVEPLNPSEKIRASNAGQRIFIDALQEVFDLLARDSGVPKVTTAAHSPSLERDNLFFCLTVHGAVDSEAENLTAELSPARPVKETNGRVQ